MTDPVSLPPLRQELSLHPGPTGEGGAPGWVLHDPAANRFYQLSWPAFEILSRWTLGSAEAVVEAVNQATTLQLGMDEVAAVADFLGRHHLLQPGAAEHTERFARIAQAGRLGHAKWLLKHYLFFRIPLLRPMPLLKRLAPAFAAVFEPRFWWLVAAVALVGLLLLSRRWDEFTHTFSAYSGVAGLAGIGLSLSVAKVLHELGHALTAYRFGCRVPAMGVAFLVMLPVLYTDTNEAWKLPSRRQRLLIGAAGMLAELTLAVLATLLWNFLPDGPLRAGVFMLATTTWVATLAINASPFMRFDGYFLLSDWLGMPNLHGRAFAFGRWWLRRVLFGWDDPVPEALLPARQRFLIAFAFATWLYRLVLFLGIALLVYHYFFKALGIVLFLVELGWFIAMPLWSEVALWWQRRQELEWLFETRRTALLSAALLLAVAVPWQSEVRAPAVFGARQATSLYAPAAADVVGVKVREGQWVRAGQLLFTLRSPELEADLHRAVARADALRWQIDQQPFDDTLLAEGQALTKQWQVAVAQVDSLRQQLRRLEFRAPFAGRVVDVSDALLPGTVIAAGEKLLSLADPHTAKGEAFVGEAMLERLQAGGVAVFVADRAELPSLRCRVADIDRLSLPALDQPYLASTYGGPIPTQRMQDALQPLEVMFRVRLDQCGEGGGMLQEISGMAMLEGRRQSLLGRWLTEALAVMQREAGL
ncbi:HlyD family efflux transporter periplasmic adaptor subunit [Pseudogulbenkiania sp. MAI-1]|uniref:HlyD family efflux transporter periplasmic adaptor subunit n=1 Tax=Pseudogulbenkiania sp. MAI-1 TaxID=990370 RepID=UPI0004A315B9|nr:HlyD family efflux transporter periplasmic adaptor subunit [Pseudogulbenkiania sp. MAI-1]